ncbi:MAG: cysteine desulfurase family protein [Candidatus Woesearchaeota archaeon]
MKVYLDNGATTKVDPEVAKVMDVYLTEKYGNPSSVHDFGSEAKEALDSSRKIVAKAIGAKPEEIVFTSCGSESNNTVLKGLALSKGKGHIITTKVEHPCILETCRYLGGKGFEVTYLNVDKEGFVDLEELRNSIKEDTILVSVIHANNEVGTINDLKAIGKICKEKNIPFHSDCVQSFTKVPVDVKKFNLSFASFSAHKIHGQKGVGALYIKKDVDIDKLLHGGHQERDLRAGTENIPGIVGFAKAVKVGIDKKHVKHMTLLRDKLIRGIEKEIPNVKLNGSKERRLCNNVNFSFLGAEGESIGALLNIEGITSSNGSACSSQSLEPSHVLMALGLKHEEAQGAVRFTLSRFTTEEEINYVLAKLPKVIAKLRKISPIVEFLKKV